MASSQCCDKPPMLNPASGEGKLVDSFGGLKTYLAGSDKSKAAVILISDVFGFEAPNLRKIADKVASFGYFVVVPDFFHDDAYMPENAERSLKTWLESQTPVWPIDKCVLDQNSAKVAVELSKAYLIEAAVLLHPTFVTVDDMTEVRCPISVLGAEIDKISPPELVKQFEKVLLENSAVGHFVMIFPGAKHGWSVRYRHDDAVAVKRAEEVLTDMIGWFNKYLNLTLKLKPSL
nr:unnamed protein product [Digitaria exilis]